MKQLTIKSLFLVLFWLGFVQGSQGAINLFEFFTWVFLFLGIAVLSISTTKDGMEKIKAAKKIRNYYLYIVNLAITSVITLILVVYGQVVLAFIWCFVVLNIFILECTA